MAGKNTAQQIIDFYNELVAASLPTALVHELTRDASARVVQSKGLQLQDSDAPVAS